MLPDEGDAADDDGGDCEDEGVEAGDVVVVFVAVFVGR